MFKVVLCRAPYKAYVITPPLGIGYLSAYLRARNINSRIIDPMQGEGLSLQETAEKIRSVTPQLVGIYASTDMIPATKELIGALKKVAPGCLICIGGPHATVLPEEALKELAVDFAIMGEGEETLFELVSMLKAGRGDFENVKGLAFRKEDGRVIMAPRRRPIEEIDEIPMPSWDEIDPHLYMDAPHGIYTKHRPFAPIITSRGCPYQCTFCASGVIWGNKMRFRSAEKVVDEIESLVTRFEIRELHIIDDNFTISKPHAEGICDEMIRRGLNIPWQAPSGVRIDSLDEDLIKKLKASGCYKLAIGIESGNQQILDRARKSLDLRRVEGQINMIKRHKILLHGFFILGLPGETRETVECTLKYAKKLKLDTAQFTLFVPLPGSAIFDEWTKEKGVAQYRWDEFTMYKSVYSTEELSASDLRRLQKSVLIRYYSVPRNLINAVKYLRFKQTKIVYRLLKNYLFSK
ncbi:MAG: cobalamin B12-binding domain-containing protein [Candidatus Omnitrophica bacterium]|nr:cobalamin B12-binding domain-containing protein [Candidatus Omnitrophota bacterium]